ncbi:probable receptor-like protein kinase At5g24010 [Camellia sinensis]|uniref:probable receptor-like protein kinase At5g24010 n=1 Tax=Camellia sinensis TaxID=4442 RepID=UPI001036A8E6|nr:probable receptor-like protein kinase At5g24010 [Camellia sinensis]
MVRVVTSTVGILRWQLKDGKNEQQERHELILVYEYMVYGSLDNHLNETNKCSLNWEKRLEICIGVARGLQYLHAGTRQPIIHWNLNPAYIMLDENWNAKVLHCTVTTSSSSGASGWRSWPEPEESKLRERINHHFVEFVDPLTFPHFSRSSVVYPYVPIDRRRRLEDNLLVAWYTYSMPTKIVQATHRPEEAQGYSPSFLAQKAKLCSSDWLDIVNNSQFPPSFEIEALAPPFPQNPHWIEKLRLTLFEDQFLPSYNPSSLPTKYQRQ